MFKKFMTALNQYFEPVNPRLFTSSFFYLFIVETSVVLSFSEHVPNETSFLLVVLLVLFTKHLTTDFYWQNSWMAANKGNLFHPGGHIHALMHSIITFMSLALLIPFFHFETSKYLSIVFVIGLISVLEYIIHFAIDYWKVNFTKKHGYTIKDNEYWYLLGFDQYLHYLFYLISAGYITDYFFRT